MTYNSDDTIFVQIGSYRDPELQHTLQDLFKKAKKPENIFVGICHQYDNVDGSDKHLFEVPFPRPNQLRIDEIDYRESQGVSFARARAKKLWRGEKWVLQIDSHMRFKENWDELLVDDIKKINKDFVVLGNVPSSYSHVTNEITFYESAVSSGVFFSGSEFRCCCKSELINKTKPAASFLGAFSFGDSFILQKVLTDPLLMWHDEFPMVLRLFTEGGNIFYYDKNIVAHLFDYKDNQKLTIARSNTYKTNSLADEIVLHLTNIKKSNKEFVIKRCREYGVGNKRTLRDYERYAGIDFRRRKIREHSKSSLFEEWKETAKISEVKKLFSISEVKNFPSIKFSAKKIKFKIAIYNPIPEGFAEDANDASWRAINKTENFFTEIKSFKTFEEIVKFNPDFVFTHHPCFKIGYIPTYSTFLDPSRCVEFINGVANKKYTEVDGYLLQSEFTEKFVKKIHEPFKKMPNIFKPFALSFKTKNQFVSCINPQKLKLIYFGTNWEIANNLPTRFRTLFEQLTNNFEHIELYGEKSRWNWIKNQDCVKGKIFFSDKALLDIYRAGGVGLALGAHEFYVEGLVNNRAFEIVASGAVCIADDIPFYKEIFGDNLLYVETRDEIEMAKQIIAHFNWIKSNPAQAQDKARRAHEIFCKELSAEVILEKLINFHCELQNSKNKNF